MPQLNTRPPAVAGLFYPGDSATLKRDIHDYLASASPGSPLPHPPKAVIVPHAGYVYSGPVAASAYASLVSRRGQIHRVVLLGPTHRVAVRGLALPGTAAFETPLGQIPVDTAAVEQLRGMPQVTTSPAAHALEHSLEVQLPFLQEVLGSFTLVPLAVGEASPNAVADVLDVLWGGLETLIVISSDLSHYHSYQQATRLDTDTCAAIQDLRRDLHHEQACGATPINGLLEVARRRHLTPYRLDLRNSGDTAGDKSHVVGYASFAFIEETAYDH